MGALLAEAPVPLFILYGGEIVFLIVGLRIALWLLRGGIHREPAPGGGPPRGGGRPAPVVALRVPASDGAVPRTREAA